MNFSVHNSEDRAYVCALIQLVTLSLMLIGIALLLRVESPDPLVKNGLDYSCTANYHGSGHMQKMICLR